MIYKLYGIIIPGYYWICILQYAYSTIILLIVVPRYSKSSNFTYDRSRTINSRVIN